jgi:hypothetical protein
MYEICITNNGVVPMTRRGDRPVDRHASARAGPTILMPAPLVITKFRGGERSFAGMAKAFEVSPEVAQIRMRELRLD